MRNTHGIGRRAILAGMGALPLLLAAGTPARAAGLPLVTVTKDPGCGCCGAWADLAIEAGFEVEITEASDYVGMKRDAAVPENLWSCHTTRISGYIIEGHVPFAAIRQLLEQRPDINGIAVPGMPAGSPGMGGGVEATAEVIAWGGIAGDGRAFPLDG